MYGYPLPVLCPVCDIFAGMPCVDLQNPEKRSMVTFPREGILAPVMILTMLLLAASRVAIQTIDRGRCQ
jgi:hypothetical protein